MLDIFKTLIISLRSDMSCCRKGIFCSLFILDLVEIFTHKNCYKDLYFCNISFSWLRDYYFSPSSQCWMHSWHPKACSVKMKKRNASRNPARSIGKSSIYIIDHPTVPQNSNNPVVSNYSPSLQYSGKMHLPQMKVWVQDLTTMSGRAHVSLSLGVVCMHTFP